MDVDSSERRWRLGEWTHPEQNRTVNRTTEHLTADYQRDGAVVLRGVVTPEQLDMLRHGIDHVVDHPSSRAKVASSADDPGFFIEDFCRWRDVAEFSDFVHGSGLSALAADLMRSETVTHYHDHVLVKEPGTRQRTPWHQDQPYYDVEGRQNVSFWIPVDPVPRDACLELVAGSHYGPWCMPRSFRDHQAKWFPEGSLQELPDIDELRIQSDPDGRPRLLSWDLEPGDAIAFHMLTIHGAPGMRGPGRRRVFSWRVLGDDMVHVRRPWATSPDLDEVLGDDDPRVEGEPLSGDWFPRVWPQY